MALKASFSFFRPPSLILLVLAPIMAFSGWVTTRALPQVLSLNSSALTASQATVTPSAEVAMPSMLTVTV
ncbi:hypothetical protein D3C71_2131720 [compost metagenome]